MRFEIPKQIYFWVLAFATSVSAQNNEIIGVSPASVAAGARGVTITCTLDSDLPPPPPSGVIPDSVSVGAINGSNLQHSSQYNVQADFDIPEAATPGTETITVRFTTPNGTTEFVGSIEITSDSTAILTQLVGRQLLAGADWTLAVEASGIGLEYQWFKDGALLAGATTATLTLGDAASQDSGEYSCLVSGDQGQVQTEPAVIIVYGTLPAASGYRIVDTNQSTSFDDATVIDEPLPGDPFYGQDNQHTGYQPSYIDCGDGTIYDAVTGLHWEGTADTNRDGTIDGTDKLAESEVQDYVDTLNASGYGGYDDWRAPTIKELYSLILFSGTDASAYTGSDSSVLTPFIADHYFDYAYGDLDAGERLIDSQYYSSTVYVDTSDGRLLFGVNFADGRIKGYEDFLRGSEKTFYFMAVRARADYGVNQWVDNGDGTITDAATDLMWSQDDSATAYNWEQALAYVETLNAAGYLGYSDWRLPNVKELQSLLDYTRSPGTTASAAIDPLFNATSITNEEEITDYGYYWSCTTHMAYGGTGEAACYLSFGRGLGYDTNFSEWYDVHGAGCQRSDPKAGDPSDYPTGFGPQGDAIRIYNMVRVVRDASEPAMDGLAIALDTQEVMLSWPSEAGRNYVIEMTEDLTEGFAAVATGLVGTPPENAVVLERSTAGQCFYRVALDL